MFGRWSAGNCPIQEPISSQQHMYQLPIVWYRRRLWAHNVIESGMFLGDKCLKCLFVTCQCICSDHTNFSRLGHPVARCARVESVIWLHSSRSIRSKYLQFWKNTVAIRRIACIVYYTSKLNVQALTRPNAWNPKSVNWWQPATSMVFKYGLCCDNEVNDESVSSAHLETHNFFNWRHVAAILWMETSVMLCRGWYSNEY